MDGLSSIINRFNVVKQIPIFGKLNWFELQKISRKSKIVEYKKGDLICLQGAPPDAFYCLISGRLQAYTLGENDEVENTEYIRRGKHFGIISLLTGDDHSKNFEAINDSVILKINKRDFHRILKDIPQLGLELSHSLSQRIKSSSSRKKSVFESTVISVYSPKKGSGSSTYAINLALSLEKETGDKVIFVNINPKGSNAGVSSKEGGEASPQWKSSAADLNDLVEDYDKLSQKVLKSKLKVDLLNVVFDVDDPTLIKEISQFVSTLADDYHYVVVDLPNEMDDVVLKTLTQSDLVQLVTLDTKEDFMMTRHVIRELKEKLKNNFKTEKVQVLISGVQATCYLSFEDVNRQIDYDVYLKLPNIDQTKLNIAVVSDALTVITSDPNSEYSKIVTRVARRIGGVLVGLALGGGAALGVAHIGVIKVLEKENIPIDIVVGSSMGALIGSFWVTGNNASQLEKIGREFEIGWHMLKLVDPIIPISGLVGGRAIKSWMSRVLGNKTFYSTEVPLKIVAYDLTHREELVINSGFLVDAVRKSISIPGVIKPVLDKERVIIDGGVLNPLPTNVLTSLGIKKIIAVNVLQSPEHVAKGHEAELKQQKEEDKISFMASPGRFIRIRLGKLLKFLFTPNISDIIVQSLQSSEYLLAEQSSQHADIVIHPDLSGMNWFELYKVDDLIKAGEMAARQALPEIKKLVTENRD